MLLVLRCQTERLQTALVLAEHMYSIGAHTVQTLYRC